VGTASATVSGTSAVAAAPVVACVIRSVAIGADALAVVSVRPGAPPASVAASTAYTLRRVSASAAAPASAYSMALSCGPNADSKAAAVLSPRTTPTGTSRGVGWCSAPAYAQTKATATASVPSSSAPVLLHLPTHDSYQIRPALWGRSSD
jgi:hypothetical protein